MLYVSNMNSFEEEEEGANEANLHKLSNKLGILKDISVGAHKEVNEQQHTFLDRFSDEIYKVGGQLKATTHSITKNHTTTTMPWCHLILFCFVILMILWLLLLL